jgi:hypothetical protein
MSEVALEFTSSAFQPVSIDYHEMMAKTLSLGGAVTRGANFVWLVKDLWSFSRSFSGLLSDIERVTDLTSGLAKVPEVDLAAGLAKLQHLHEGIEEVVRLTRSRGLLNRSFTSSSIRKIMAQNEELLDFIDAIQVSLMPDTKADFEEALRELRGRETVSLESLRF